MRAKDYQEIAPRMLTQKQAEIYTGMGRTVLNSFASDIGARRKIGKKVLYDKRVIDAALDSMTEETV